MTLDANRSRYRTQMLEYARLTHTTVRAYQQRQCEWKNVDQRAMVVSQLGERSLPTQRSEVRNQSLANFLCTFCQLFVKTKIKKKSPGMAYLTK